MVRTGMLSFPTALLALLREGGAVRPSQDARSRLYEELRRTRRLDRYADLLTLFQDDGWVFPRLLLLTPSSSSILQC